MTNPDISTETLKPHVYLIQQNVVHHEAAIFDGRKKSGEFVETWVKLHRGTAEYLHHYSVVRVQTNEGVYLARVGDWVIKTPEGNFEVVEGLDFDRRYTILNRKEN